MIRKPLTNILIKPAGPDCGMACGYCFYSGKGTIFPDTAVHRMSGAILEESIRQLMAQPHGEVSVSWQGGEPTLMGPDFYKKAAQLQERYGHGKTVGNGIQTGGILIDRDWARFFKEYKFLVGLSIDGSGHVHDRYRRTRAGGPTWAKVRDAARLMLDEGVAVNALSVVNDYSVRFPEETYGFLKELGLSYMQFIPCVEPDPADGSRAAPFSVSGKELGQFLITIFDLWRADFIDGAPTTSVRFFESLLFGYAGMPPSECTLMGECGPYLVVEHNGDVYSCDFFVEPKWRLGNVMKGRLADMLNSPAQDEFARQKAALPDRCAQCRWLERCRGGCPKDRLRDARDGGLNHFCEALSAFFDHADAELARLVAEWSLKQEALELTRRAAAAGAIGRNDPCPCGSGRKYKKCCGRAPSPLA
ncbi:MAG TPA: anaerobic sulfatase maturase [Spirochaetota bacterium]|nr:anaerobic sulfatase maturase [Spirochaetota bacterium]